MEREEIFGILRQIFREVFDDDLIEPHDGMTAAEVDRWDSLSNIRMIVAVEQELNIQFSTAEISGLANVGELVTVIQNNLNG